MNFRIKIFEIVKKRIENEAGNISREKVYCIDEIERLKSQVLLILPDALKT